MKAEDILLDTVNKLIQIDTIIDWHNELLSKAPPVLWFGNSKSIKPKILTIGANPSRWEFLNNSGKKNWPSPLTKSFYETKYLINNRFFQLLDNEHYKDILTNNSLMINIIKSYDEYFINNPYKWFGSNKADSYNAEGVLRGMDASYFEVETKFRACHIDIFPFATLSDFNAIQEIVRRDILAYSWSKNIVDRLLYYFDPKSILIFGRSNMNYFCEYFDVNKGSEIKWNAKKGNGKCSYWCSKYGNYIIIGVSVNLGNPKGFDAVGLNELGKELQGKTFT